MAGTAGSTASSDSSNRRIVSNMKTILVAYTTNSGSTEEVARAIGAEIERSGQPVEVCRLEDVTDLAAYSAVVIGAPMILGWSRAAQNFVKKHRQALSKLRVAYFATAMSLTQPGQDWHAPVPLSLDPELAAPPVNPGRLSMKERYTSVSNYLGPMLRAAPEVRPVSVAFFGGKLEMFRLAWWQALFVMIVIRAQAGDYRNWDFIKQWGGSLGGLLAGE